MLLRLFNVAEVPSAGMTRWVALGANYPPLSEFRLLRFNLASIAT